MEPKALALILDSLERHRERVQKGEDEESNNKQGETR